MINYYEKFIYYNLNAFIFIYLFLKKIALLYNLKSKFDYHRVLFTNQRKLSTTRHIQAKP